MAWCDVPTRSYATAPSPRGSRQSITRGSATTERKRVDTRPRLRQRLDQFDAPHVEEPHRIGRKRLDHVSPIPDLDIALEQPRERADLIHQPLRLVTEPLLLRRIERSRSLGSQVGNLLCLRRELWHPPLARPCHMPTWREDGEKICPPDIVRSPFVDGCLQLAGPKIRELLRRRHGSKVRGDSNRLEVFLHLGCDQARWNVEVQLV